MNNTIKFSYPLSKLFHNSSPIDGAVLLQVIQMDYSDLTAEFRDYDTDFGKYPIPQKGECLLLIFAKKGGVFTTVRKDTSENRAHYFAEVGNVFYIEISHDQLPY